MKYLTDYKESTTDYELFSFFYDRIISGEITKFSRLMETAGSLSRKEKNYPVMMNLFNLIKRIYWGFFSEMNKENHLKLWKELVIPDQNFPDAGDLKDTLQISNLYVAMLDIHGYTQFCMDSRKNLSMMHNLDNAMNSQSRRISSLCHTVSQRERGDEVVVIASTATDALTATLAIIDFFGKTNYLGDPKISTQREGNTEALPAFNISAGITGGNTQSPLIITEKGTLAGFLLNSGARLQNRANELSGNESRIMISKQVHMNFLKENENKHSHLVKKNIIYFLDTGQIEFKGVQIPSCEVVFRGKDKYKERYSAEMNQLFSSIQAKVWEQKIFTDMINLVMKAVQVMPGFTVAPPKPLSGMQTVTNESVAQICRNALKAYAVDEDYITAINLLKTLVSIFEVVPSFDRLIFDYLKGITDKYDMLLSSYTKTIDAEIDNRAEDIFQGRHLQAWHASKNAAGVYEKLKAIGRKSNEIPKKKALWFSLIKQNAAKMDFTLRSGKR